MAPTIAVLLKVDGDDPVASLRETGEKLDAAGGEMVLDFSRVRRLDSAALTALEQFASVAAAKSVKVALRGVRVDVYKVLKLTRLASRFSYLD